MLAPGADQKREGSVGYDFGHNVSLRHLAQLEKFVEMRGQKHSLPASHAFQDLVAVTHSGGLAITKSRCAFQTMVSTEASRTLHPTTGNIIMDKLYCNTAHHDVFVALDHDESAAGRMLERLPLERLRWIFNHKPVIIGAHKHVLRHWSNFLRLFESGFVKVG